MKIVVIDKTIETKDIADIVDVKGTRIAGFKIIMIDNVSHVFSESIPYDTTHSHEMCIHDKYEKLRKSVTEKWQEDKSDIPVFKL